MRETYKSCDAISESILKSPKFSAIREVVRFTVNDSLSKEKSKIKNEPRILGHRDRLIHSLVQNWLAQNDYPLAAIAMKAEMRGTCIDNPDAYVASGTLFENNLNLRSEKNLPPIKSEEELEKDNKLPVSGKSKEQVIKIAEFSENLEKSMKDRLTLETERKNRIIENSGEVIVETSSEETTSARTESDSTSSSEEEEEEEVKEETKSWGPSKSALVTDNLPTSNAQSVDDKEETKQKEKVNNEDDLEELKYTEDESVDDLEDFDTGLLSSGGSEFSF